MLRLASGRSQAVRSALTLTRRCRHAVPPLLLRQYNSHTRLAVTSIGAAIAALAIYSHATPVPQCKEYAPPAVNPALCRAVLLNDEEAVRRLLQAGYSPDTKHPLGWSPLHVAAINGNARMVAVLLDAGADVDARDTYSIQDAARGTGTHVIDVVRVRAAEFSRRIHPQTNTKGFTALMYAVLADNAEIVQRLLDAGANPVHKNEDGHTAREYVDKGATPNAEAIADVLESSEMVYAVRAEEEEKERRRRYPFEQRITERIVGQTGAIRTVGAAIRRKENGFMDEERPLVFLFLGSSGIGKTETAKQIAAYMHQNKPEAFIRIDMSEYQSKHEVAKFIGSPPGYVGHEEGGQLSEKLKACGDAVVLLDEIEKAHPEVLQIMLQLFDEGRLTDGKGNTVDARNAIFVMTSNLAQDEIAEYGLVLREQAARANEDPKVSAQFRDTVIRPILKAHFRMNEFIGRINEIVYFLPFSADELVQLVTLDLAKWRDKTKQRHGVDLSWSDRVAAHIAKGYDVHYGARSLKYELDRQVLAQLAQAWEQGDIVRNSRVYVDVDAADRVTLKVDKPDPNTGTGGLLGLLKRS